MGGEKRYTLTQSIKSREASAVPQGGIQRASSPEASGEGAGGRKHRVAESLTLETADPLHEAVDILLRRKWIAVAVFLVVMLASLLYIRFAPPVFTSEATIEFDERKTMKEDRFRSGPDHRDIKPYVNTQIEVLKSRSLAEAVVDQLKLLEKSESTSQRNEVPHWGLTFQQMIKSLVSGSGSANGLQSADDASKNALVTHLLSRLSVKPVKSSNLVSVSMNAGSPEEARELLQTLLSTYLARNLEHKRKESFDACEWLKVEMERAQQKLLESQAALVEFTIEHGIVGGPDGGVTHAMNTINKVMEGHLRAQESRLRIQAMRDQAANNEESLLPKEMHAEYVGKLKAQLASYEAEYSEKKVVYSPTFPKMKILAQKIDFLKARIAEIERGAVNSALETAQREEGLFNKSFEQVKMEADRVKGLEAQYAVLKKEVETNQEFHKILLREFKEQEIKARTATNDVRIVDSPTIPTKPSAPRKRLILFLALVVGLSGGIAAAFLVDRLDPRVFYPHEIERDFQVPRLAVIPDMTQELKRNASETNGKALEFIVRTKPMSPAADAIRNLQTAILLGGMDSRLQCLAVSSANPEQGKTLLAVSVATALGSGKKRILLVDGDMRRPRVHKVFGLEDPAEGLSDFLESDSYPIKRIVRFSHFKGLAFITAGSLKTDPVELLQSPRMGYLIERLRSWFDHVIIDCPPLLELPDAQLISLHTDGVILVAMQGGVAKAELREAIRVLTLSGTSPIVGIVLNKTKAFGGRYSYRYGGYYYYGSRKYYRGYASRAGNDQQAG